MALLVAALLALGGVGDPAAWAAGSTGTTGTGTTGTGTTGVVGSAGSDWVPSFTSAMAWTPGQAVDTTVRQVVPLGVGGKLVRVQLANTFGTGPLAVGAATVGVQAVGAAAIPGSFHALTFGGAAGVEVPIGGTVWSDPLPLSTSAGESLLVSVWVSGPAIVSAHYDAGPMSYATADYGGDQTLAASGSGFGLPSTWDRWVSTVDVAGGGPTSATVAFGDSISDGFNKHCGFSDVCQLTTPWPTWLQKRVTQLPAAQQTAVVDESITANTLTTINTPKGDQFRTGGGGPPGLTRMAADLLDQPGVRRVILLLGTNDLWFGATADQLIAGYRTFVARAKARGIEVIGSTLLPRAGSEGWTATDEQERNVVNHWILTSHTFPVVLDLAAVVANVYNGACQPDQMFPPFNSGDSLHPNTAGQLAMANAIPTTLIGAPSTAELAPLTKAVPTSGCPHPVVVRDTYAAGASGTADPATTVPSTTTPSTTTPSTTAPTGTTPTGTSAPSTTTRGTSATAASSTGAGSGPGGVGSLAWAVVVILVLAVAAAFEARRRQLRRRRRLLARRRAARRSF